MDITFQNFSIQRVVGVPAHEKTPQRLDQRPQWKHPGPFAHCIRQTNLIGRQVGHQQVIHVTAMVHDKNNGRFDVYRLQLFGISSTDLDPINKPRDFPCQPVADAEINQRIERRNDFPGIVIDSSLKQLPGHTFARCLGFNFFDNPGIVDQPVNQNLAFCALEGTNLYLQSLVELFYGTIQPSSEKPSDAGHQDAHYNSVDTPCCKAKGEPER